jgi:hypothetical protein
LVTTTLLICICRTTWGWAPCGFSLGRCSSPSLFS